MFGYFNGVMTSRQQASEAMKHMKTLYGAVSPQGDPVRYETFYNLSQGFLTDLAEVFNQRTAEQTPELSNRFELFWENLGEAGGWWDLLTGDSEPLRAFQQSLREAAKTAAVQATSNLLAQEAPVTTVTQVEHKGRLDTLALEGKKLLLFAHSQGNLFANTAYRYVTHLLPSSAVKVVHVAPASTNLNGAYVLADQDLVINALRATGPVPPNNVSIPPALQRTPGANGKSDLLGHGLLPIYLHPGLSTSSMVDDAVSKAMSSMIAPPVRAQSGFFTATLTWDGEGDVDLHTLEPSGAHVFFGNPVGRSGHLDVDNRTGYGPEHYYASCSLQSLQVGTYRIALANYAFGQGRTARVQIASSADGVLGTRQVTLGAATGSTPSVNVFDVNVYRDAGTGRVRVGISG